MIAAPPLQRPETRRAGAAALRWLALGALGLAIPGCMPVPQHYSLSALPLTAEQGWVQLPTRRWLVNPGINLAIALFCPAESCAHEPAFVARFELDGTEAGFADLLARDPAAALSATRPSRARQGGARTGSGVVAPVGTRDVSPLVIAGWSGGSVRLESRQGSGKAAEIGLVARREQGRAVVLMAVAPTRKAVIRHLAAAAS